MLNFSVPAGSMNFLKHELNVNFTFNNFVQYFASHGRWTAYNVVTLDP